MIKVHHLNNSRSQRILWLLEELGVKYEIVPYQRDKTTRLAPPELKAIHPLGKSPVITDDGKAIAESGAIIEYLVRQYGKGKFIPKDGTPEAVDHMHWMHYAEGSAMLPLMLAMYTGFLGDAAAPLLPRIMSEIDNHLGYVNKALANRDFLVGKDLTGADVQMTFVLEAAQSGGRLKDYPNLVSYLTKMQARPAYKKAIERGGPYDIGRVSRS
jgi:glutathione S-transferase